MATDIDGDGKSRDMGGVGLDVEGQCGGFSAEALWADADFVDGF